MEPQAENAPKERSPDVEIGTLGRAMKAARAYSGLSRKELADGVAEATGRPWTEDTVRDIENGKLDVTGASLRGLAHVTRISPMFFLYGPDYGIEHFIRPRE